MALANGSVDVTPGTGETIAVEDIGGKGYEVWVAADAAGHITGGRATYTLGQSGAIFPTADHNLCALWNGVGSGVTVEILDYWAAFEDTAGGDVFNTANWPRVYRITAPPSAGTTRTAGKFKTSSPALPAQVLLYGEGVTATRTGAAFDAFTLMQGTATQMGLLSMQGGALRSSAEPLVLVEGEGIVVHGGDNGNVSNSGTQLLTFRVR